MRAYRVLSTIPVVLGVSVIFGNPASAQTEHKLSAREIFYSAPAAPPAKAKAGLPAAPAPKPTRASDEKRPKPAAVSSTSQDEKVQKGAPVVADAPQRTTVSSPDEVTTIIPATYRTGPSIPLGLRLSILKKIDGDQTEVDPETQFRSGDRIRIRVEVNDTGYLYIVHRGSSGIWKPLFPSAEVAGGNNLATRGKVYELPSGYVFTFDEQPGKEKLFVILSREPEEDLEKLVYSLSTGAAKSAPSPDRAPAPQPALMPERPPRDEKVLLSMNRINIDDQLVARLQNAYSRDLIIEKVNEDAPSSASSKPGADKAIYVVNPTGSTNSRVVAELTLIHN